MADLPEQFWKRRFAHTLARLFIAGGVRPDAALHDAYAHAEVAFPQHGAVDPEAEAAAEFASLSPEMTCDTGGQHSG